MADKRDATVTIELRIGTDWVDITKDIGRHTLLETLTLPDDWIDAANGGFSCRCVLVPAVEEQETDAEFNSRNRAAMFAERDEIERIAAYRATKSNGGKP